MLRFHYACPSSSAGIQLVSCGSGSGPCSVSSDKRLLTVNNRRRLGLGCPAPGQPKLPSPPPAHHGLMVLMLAILANGSILQYFAGVRFLRWVRRRLFRWVWRRFFRWVLASVPPSGPGVGSSVGSGVGSSVGSGVGSSVGAGVGSGVAVGMGVGAGVGVGIGVQFSVVWQFEHCPRGCPSGRAWQALHRVYPVWSKVTGDQSLIEWQFEHCPGQCPPVWHGRTGNQSPPHGW
jgi:hypothetical protein